MIYGRKLFGRKLFGRIPIYAHDRVFTKSRYQHYYRLHCLCIGVSTIKIKPPTHLVSRSLILVRQRPAGINIHTCIYVMLDIAQNLTKWKGGMLFLKTILQIIFENQCDVTSRATSKVA